MGREKFLAGLAQMDSTGLWSDNKKEAGELIRYVAAGDGENRGKNDSCRD